MSFQLTCEQCSRPFECEKRGQRFCGRTCTNRARKEVQIKDCAFCSKEFRPNKKAQTYCSLSCAYQDSVNQIEYTCQHCGKSFFGRTSRPSTYCSRKCLFGAKRTLPDKNCTHCGNPIPRKDLYRNPQYCCMACRSADNRKETECLQCGKSFIISKTSIRKFCSQTCSNRYDRPITRRSTFVCEWCGKQFEHWMSRPNRFCSQLCRSKYGGRQPKPKLRRPENFVTLPCEVCGNHYTVHKVQTEKHNSRFCSRKCKYIAVSESMKGENNPNYIDGTGHLYPGRGLNWQQQRGAALERDGFKCQVCGTDGNGVSLDVHHIIPYRLFNDDWQQANRLDNLVTLCRQCHVPVEDGKIPCPTPTQQQNQDTSVRLQSQR